MSIGNDEYIQWLQWVFESFKLSFQITVYLLQDGQISEGSFENSNYRGNHSHSPTKILKQQAIAKHRMTSKLEHLHGFASRKLGPLGVFFLEQLYCHPVLPTWPKKTWTDSFWAFKDATICKAQFLSHTTQSKQMRFGRNQQFWDDSLVSAYFRLDSHILFVPLTWRSSFFPCFFPCKLFNEAISGCRQHAGGMLHSAFHISVPSLTGWILLSRTKRSFGTSLWQWLEQMCLWHAMSLVVFFFVFWVFSCNLSCRSLWHFKRTCLDFFWNNKAANEENMKDSGRFRNSIDFQVEIVIVCQNKPTSSIRSTSILFQTTKIWSPSPPWPASFIQWKAPKLAIPPWV